MGRKPGRMHVKGSLGGNRLYPDFLAISWYYNFCSGEDTVEYMSLFTADGFEGTPIDCNEGVLEWVEKTRFRN